jgi:hypothetical protein
MHRLCRRAYFFHSKGVVKLRGKRSGERNDFDGQFTAVPKASGIIGCSKMVSEKKTESSGIYQHLPLMAT